MNRIGKITNPHNKLTDWQGIMLVIVIQALLICLVFPHIIFSGGKDVFSNQYDGVKNYYTLQGYVQQKEQVEYLKFSLMNYPYGDYIFYTDNTPLVAVPLRFLLHDVLHQPGNAIYFFNLFILIGIIISSVILFKLLRFFSLCGIVLVLFSIMLPWLSPQMLRLFGHFSLTQSWILLLVIYLLCRQASSNSFRYDIFLMLVMFLSGFIHMYYLLLSLVFVSGYFFLHALNEAIHKRKWIPVLVRGMVISLVSLGFFFLTIRLLDNYYEMRRVAAEGYDWDDWKLQIRGLFSPYYFNPLNQLLGLKSLPYESFSYMGTGILIGSAGIIAFFLIHLRNIKHFYLEACGNKNFKIAAILFGASLIGLSIALGERVNIAGNFHVTNYLSPFYYLRRVIPQITHFRCLGRFSWFFFWMMNICMVLLVLELSLRHRYFRILLFLSLAGFLFDFFFALKHFSSDYNMRNPFYKDALNEVSKSMEMLQPDKYQAILALPFYHVGSEDYNYTIDPEDGYCIKTMQISLASGLPLMNSKMSRTPLQHTYNIFSLFEENISDSLLLQLKDSRVLVYRDKDFYNNDSLLVEKVPHFSRMPAKEVLEQGHRIIEKYGMKKLFEDEKTAWYEWDIN